MKAEQIVHLASTAQKPKVEIGSRWTGRHEYIRNTVTGEFHELRPPLEGFALLLQTALCPPQVFRMRDKKDIRQKP
jgi:hypothetical protein